MRKITMFKRIIEMMFQTETFTRAITMQSLLLMVVTFLAIAPITTSAQVPNLGTAINFALFTSFGNLDNTATSVITGNVGTNSGITAGFGSPSTVNGTIEIGNAITAQCATDVQTAYTEIIGRTVTVASHTPEFGAGETLLAGVYAIAAAGSLSGNLTLDGNSSSIFIFKFGGAITVAASSSVTLINGVQASNVFWVANGAIAVGAATAMKGTLIASPGAVSMGADGNLEGRMLSTTGAVTSYHNVISIPTSSPLPISLLYFSARCDEQNIVLEWCTATESNNDFFTIERRSGNELEWQTAGVVAGAGNSYSQLYYELKDVTANSAGAYYRLKQTDFDGRFEYSDIIRSQKCETLANGHLSIYPNPNSGRFNLLFDGDKTEITSIEIFNSQGKKVYSAMGFPSTFDLSNYASGFYFMRVNINSEVIGLDLILNN